MNHFFFNRGYRGRVSRGDSGYFILYHTMIIIVLMRSVQNVLVCMNDMEVGDLFCIIMALFFWRMWESIRNKKSEFF